MKIASIVTTTTISVFVGVFAAAGVSGLASAHSSGPLSTPIPVRGTVVGIAGSNLMADSSG